MLPAVMSGNGPDVALCISQTEPVNYALRGATVDLTQFSDYKDVLSEYQASSYESYWLKDKSGHKGLYGLPETENYNVLFYRTDIMEELGIGGHMYVRFFHIFFFIGDECIFVGDAGQDAEWVFKCFSDGAFDTFIGYIGVSVAC